MYWQLLIFVLKLIHPFFKVFLIFFIHHFDNLENFPFFLITSSSFESLFYSALKVFLLFFNHNFDNFEILVHFSSNSEETFTIAAFRIIFFSLEIPLSFFNIRIPAVTRKSLFCFFSPQYFSFFYRNPFHAFLFFIVGIPPSPPTKGGSLVAVISFIPPPVILHR